VVAATLAVAAVPGALLVGVLAPRLLSTVAAFELHRLSGVHTLPAEVLADQVSHLDSIMVVIACPPCGRRDSPAQWVRPQDRISAGPPRLLGSQTAQAQLQLGTVPQIRGFRLQQIVSQIA
jgi:hypothetical protein